MWFLYTDTFELTIWSTAHVLRLILEAFYDTLQAPFLKTVYDAAQDALLLVNKAFLDKMFMIPLCLCNF